MSSSNRPAFLIFDIETICDGRLLQRVRYPGEDDLAPASSIARHREELLEKTGSDFIPGTFQLPVSVAIAKVASDCRLQDVVTLDRPRFRPQVITRQFWKGWVAYGQPTLVTFNGRCFDVPVLELAAFRYGIPIPQWLRIGAKSWEDPRGRYNQTSHLDLQDVLTNYGAMRMNGGLNLLASLLGKPGKMDTKGEMVQDLWEAGEHIRIDDYCVCDSLDTYFVFLRVRVLQGLLTRDQERECVQGALEWIEAHVEKYEVLKTYLQNFGVAREVGDEDWPFLEGADAPST